MRYSHQFVAEPNGEPSFLTNCYSALYTKTSSFRLALNITTKLSLPKYCTPECVSMAAASSAG
jgi:hypothetical protein